ncbi:DUF317 domain-containing protein, partial [Streptomyces sp. SID11233]|nr:DUF317 domain-containing protein [Streptomyces sp. SID11233]
MNTPLTRPPARLAPAVEGRRWLSGDGAAGPVLDLLDSLGWRIVGTPETNVHAMSPDGHVYVGWLPEDPTAWK